MVILQAAGRAIIPEAHKQFFLASILLMIKKMIKIMIANL